VKVPRQVCKQPAFGHFQLGHPVALCDTFPTVPQAQRATHIAHAKKSQRGRWSGLDNDVSDDQVRGVTFRHWCTCDCKRYDPDGLVSPTCFLSLRQKLVCKMLMCPFALQQDITRGRDMVDSLFQGPGGSGGTHNATLSSSDYLSAARKSFDNMSDGFYISPSFLDKMSIHIAKNFMDLPKIKVPLILGIWGGKGQVRHHPHLCPPRNILAAQRVASSLASPRCLCIHDNNCAPPSSQPSPRALPSTG
jgi:hypothetical protein